MASWKDRIANLQWSDGDLCNSTRMGVSMVMTPGQGHNLGWASGRGGRVGTHFGTSSGVFDSDDHWIIIDPENGNESDIIIKLIHEALHHVTDAVHDSDEWRARSACYVIDSGW